MNYWTQIIVSQQTRNICITFVQRRPNVFDVGPPLYTCYKKALCLFTGIGSDKDCGSAIFFLMPMILVVNVET